jgi:hypothetical protein
MPRMRRWLPLLSLVLLGACPAVAKHELTVRAVSPGGDGVSDAMVGAMCQPSGSTAGLTDAGGTARMELRSPEPLRACKVVVAKQGFTTAEAELGCKASACGPADVTVEPAP